MGFGGKLRRSKQDEHGVSMKKFRVPDPRPESTFEDGLRFVASLKLEFADEPDKYDEIMATMGQFKSGSLPTAAVVERMKLLLEGHPALLRHFNHFLPWGYVRAHGPVGGICA